MERLHLLIIAVLLLLTTACGSSKKTTVKNNVHNIEQTNTQIVQTQTTKQTANETATENRNVNSEQNSTIVNVEFDTSKPINPVTQTPPVKTITITKHDKKAADKTTLKNAATIVTTNDNIIKTEIEHKTEITDKSISINEIKESKKTKWIMWIFISIAVVSLSFVTYKIISKFKK